MKFTTIQFANPFEQTARGKIALIGMLEDGPVQRGFLLNKDVSPFILGECELSYTYSHLIASGIAASDIYIYRLNGRQSSLSFAQEGIPFFELQAIGGHQDDNQIRMTVSREGISITGAYSDEAKEKRNKKDFLRTYLFSEYPYLSSLVDAVNQDANLGLVDVVARNEIQGLCADFFIETGVYPMSGGDAEMAAILREDSHIESQYAAYWERFFLGVLGKGYTGESQTRLMELQAELLLFTDLRPSTSRSVTQFAAKVAEQITNQQLTLCSALFSAKDYPAKKELSQGDYMVSPTTYFDHLLGEVQPYLPEADQDAYLEEMSGLFSTEERGMTHMQYLQIVIGACSWRNKKISGAASYAALYLLSESDVPLSNSKLPNYTDASVFMKKEAVATLNDSGYICIVPSIRKGMVPSFAQTVAKKELSMLKSLSNQRMVAQITSELSHMLMAYIGQPLHYFVKGTVEKAISERLSYYVNRNSLANYQLLFRDDYWVRPTIGITLSLYDEIVAVKGKIQLEEDEWVVEIWNNVD